MVEHGMRKKNRQLNEEESLTILHKGEYGILSTVTAENKPYGVPLSYSLGEKKIYFHSAIAGYKIENLAHCPYGSFCVVGDTQPVHSKGFSTYYESVIVAGKIVPIIAQQEKYDSLFTIAKRYFPEAQDDIDPYITKLFDRTYVYALVIEQITGKAKRKK